MTFTKNTTINIKLRILEATDHYVTETPKVIIRTVLKNEQFEFQDSNEYKIYG